MAALIFYKKHIDSFECFKHPMKNEMDTVLRMKDDTSEGWLPLKEMQARAEMYGVDLYNV